MPKFATAEVIVLRNGGVLEGSVVEANSAYVISLGGRAETTLPKSSVKFVCGSMREAYEIQREKNAPNDADAHIELARWCVKYSLITEARTELAAIPESRRGDIRIGVIERKIKLQQESFDSRQQATNDPNSENPGVSPASHVENHDFQKHAENRDIELQRLLEKVSTRSIAGFNKEVQTRLLHGCATAGCHSSGSDNAFLLHCESPYRAVPRRMMFQNFANCYQLIDESNREESKLLKYLVTPHGDQKKPVYRIGSKHYEAIRKWVLTAGENDEQNNAFATTLDNPTADTKPGWQEVNDNAKFEGVDPFDANVFNRRYGVDRVEETSTDDASSNKNATAATTNPQPTEPVGIPRRLSAEQTANAQPALPESR